MNDQQAIELRTKLDKYNQLTNHRDHLQEMRDRVTHPGLVNVDNDGGDEPFHIAAGGIQLFKVDLYFKELNGSASRSAATVLYDLDISAAAIAEAIKTQLDKRIAVLTGQIETL